MANVGAGYSSDRTGRLLFLRFGKLDRSRRSFASERASRAAGNEDVAYWPCFVETLIAWVAINERGALSGHRVAMAGASGVTSS